MSHCWLAANLVLALAKETTPAITTVSRRRLNTKFDESMLNPSKVLNEARKNYYLNYKHPMVLEWLASRVDSDEVDNFLRQLTTPTVPNLISLIKKGLSNHEEVRVIVITFPQSQSL